MELKITVYNEDDEAIKTCTAHTVDIKFGQVSAIMELMEVEKIENDMQMLSTIHKAWKQLVKILSKIFPDMTDDDWEFVSLKELLPVMVQIIKESFKEMMNIPKSKNA